MAYKLFLCCLLISGVLNICECYKVLVIFPFPGVSHALLGHGYVKRLLEAGHEVTYITSRPMKKESTEYYDKLRQIDVSSLFSSQAPSEISINGLINKQFDRKDYSFALLMGARVAHALVTHDDVKRLLHDENETFDLLIVEWLFSEVYAGFAVVFNCPYIWAASMEPDWMVLRLIDEPTNPAYTTDLLSEGMAPLSFSERVQNLWVQLKVRYLCWKAASSDNEAYERGFKSAAEKRGRTLTPLEVAKYNASLVFANCHVSSGMALSLPPNYKPIAGHYIDEEPPLPDDLKKLMDNSNQGVIYFSMGTILQSKDMSDNMKTSLLKMFGRRPETVIWKFEADLPNVPKNVHIVKFAPQRSILAHQNLKLFITHGGLLSTNEALHYSKPVIGVPGFGDQHQNVLKAERKGFAVKVDLDENIAENLDIAINEVLNNPKYKERVQQLSFIYHDRLVKPGAEINHWVRHVIETGGASHLRSIAFMVPWYQKLYVDLIVLVLIVVYVIYFTFNKLFCSFVKRKNKVD